MEQSSLDFRLKKIDEMRNYEIKHNDLISEKYKKIFKYLSYVENLLILASTITSYVSVSAFNSLVDINVSITSSSVGINICAKMIS